MKFEPVNLVHVYYAPNHKKIPVGRLALESRNIFFEYDSQFLESDIQISPFKLPLGPGVIPSTDPTFNGLFGVFNDSLPDGWGRVLLDRKLAKHNLNPNSLSALDRLCLVGKNGMGALTYEPEIENSPTITTVDLDEIASQVQEFQEQDEDRFVEDLLNLGGSSAGARPKILLNREGKEWLIKFRSIQDPNDSGAIEYAYYLMAIEAGLEVAESVLFPSKKGKGFFGTKRFDRHNGESIHMHSISGLLHADHREPSLDYQLIIKATMHLTHDIRQCEKQFRLCVFNVLSHNRDDHAKNFSFLMNKEGEWQVSPAYDLTCSAGPNGEHCTMVMGEGKHPDQSHLLELATLADIKQEKALEIIDQVASAINQWPHYAEKAGVSKTNKNKIKSILLGKGE